MKEIKVLITGANGQVGRALRNAKLLVDRLDCVFMDRSQFDLSNPTQMTNVLRSHRPNYVINAAAYTAVDKAEKDVENATAINATAPAIIAKTMNEWGGTIVHFSTDYVYSNKETFDPLTETDPTEPQSVYGQTKLKGEQGIIANNPRHVILRTSWVYSENGNNFVNAMLRLGAERDYINIVYDQYGAPTYAHELSNAAALFIYKSEADPEYGVYNCSNSGFTNWYQFGQTIFNKNKIDCVALPVSSKEFGAPAPRPHWSVLDNSKFNKTLGFTMSPWKKAFDTMMNKKIG